MFKVRVLTFHINHNKGQYDWALWTVAYPGEGTGAAFPSLSLLVTPLLIGPYDPIPAFIVLDVTREACHRVAVIQWPFKAERIFDCFDVKS